MNISRNVLAGIALLFLAACQQPAKPPLVASSKSALELRSMQARSFDTGDRNKTVRTVIATLQDLGYSIDKVETQTGTVSATKLAVLRMTVTVTPRGDNRLVVRANAIVVGKEAEHEVDDPAFFQQRFFEPLSKAMFLSANAADET